MSSVFDALMTIVGSTVMLAVPAYLVLQPWAAFHLKGPWRFAALAPLILAGPILIWCAYAFVDQSNLWPVPFLLFAPFATSYLGFLVLLHRWNGPRAA
jgi:hypothetical protein